MLVNIDEVVPGSVDGQTGAGTLGEAGPDRSGVVDEIACRLWLAGRRVVAVRGDDSRVVGILHYTPVLR